MLQAHWGSFTGEGISTKHAHYRSNPVDTVLALGLQWARVPLRDGVARLNNVSPIT